MKTRIFCHECDKLGRCSEEDCYAQEETLYRVTIPEIVEEIWWTCPDGAADAVEESTISRHYTPKLNITVEEI